MNKRSCLDRAHELRMFADGLSAPYIVPSTKETMALAMRSAANEMEELAKENAKLRELAQDMWPFARNYLSMLPSLGICDIWSDDLYMRMRKLGVEADT